MLSLIFSHYAVQVSQDKSDWYSLGFNGTWYDELDEQTIVYDNSIPHTRVPHNDDGSVKTLYYRVACITNAGLQSDWSDDVPGSTNWFYQDEDWQLAGDYVYSPSGSIIVSGSPYILGPNDHPYDGSGTVTISGEAEYTNVVDSYSYAASGFMEMSGTAPKKFTPDYIYSVSGGVETSGTATSEYDTVGEIILGTEYSYSPIGANGDSSIISTAVLDSETMVLSYTDSTVGAGKCCIMDIDGTIITHKAGLEYEFASDVYNVYTEALSSSLFVNVYRDQDNSDYGTIVAGSVSGTMITLGTPVVFYYNSASDFNVTKISETQALIVFRDLANSYGLSACIATISGTTITLGSTYYAASQNDTFAPIVKMLDTDTFVITYQDYVDGDGKAIIGSISGSTISFGTPVSFTSYAIDGDEKNNGLAVLNDSKFIIAWQEDGNADYGVARVGTVSGTTITFGTQSTFNSATTSPISICATSETEFAISHDETMLLGSVDGTDLTFYSGYTFTSNSILESELHLLDTNKLINTSRNTSVTGTIYSITGEI